MTKLVTSLRTHLIVDAPGKHSSFRKNVTAEASSWQRCVRFEGPRIKPQTSRSRDECVYLSAKLTAVFGNPTITNRALFGLAWLMLRLIVSQTQKLFLILKERNFLISIFVWIFPCILELIFARIFENVRKKDYACRMNSLLSYRKNF